MRSVLSILALAVFVTACLTSCFDPAPGELIARCKFNGKERSCTVMIYNSAGNQIQEIPTDSYGVGFVKALVPDTYTLKFKDVSGNMYPAVRTVKLVADSSLPVDIELSNESGIAE